LGSGISTKYDKTEGLKSFEKAKTNKNVINEVQNTMPCYKEAYTEPKKFYEYSLDDTNINGVDKAIHYKKSLGFDKTNGDLLIEQIDSFVKSDSSVPESIVQTVHGARYKYKVPVTRVNGEHRNVIAVYQIDKGNVIPRLITNFLE